MIQALILFVVYLILLGVVVWAIRKIVAVIPMDATVANVVNVAVLVITVLIIVILVLNILLPMFGIHSPLPAP